MGEIMSLLDLLRQEYVKGRVVDKYRIGNGNIGLVYQLSIQGPSKRLVVFDNRYSGSLCWRRRRFGSLL